MFGIVLLGLFESFLLVHAETVELQVSSCGGNESSPILYGFMFEDINHSGDGGIHSQLLRNNGFQGESPDLTAYGAVGDVALSVDSCIHLSSAIPHSLKISIPEGASGDVGFFNEGYWGIPVNSETYTSAFFMKGSYSGRATISLRGRASDIVYASHGFDVEGNANEFTLQETKFESKQAPDGNNIWTLTFDGFKVAGEDIYISLIQLYPRTFLDRKNGLKPSLAQPIANMKGSFLRFPGGNNLEGMHPYSRWKWNETLGPLESRPGREGTWTYPNTDALGLLEYLYWCEDMKLTPLLTVWDGLSLGQGPGDIITGDALDPYVEDVLNEIEFIRGAESTRHGALRAELGHPKPFELFHVEIGNEDQFWGGGPSYPERLMKFYRAIHEKYHDIKLIASTADYLPAQLPEGLWLTFHTYSPPNELVSWFNKFDNVDRAHPWSVSEFACSKNDNGVQLSEPNMQCSVAEAVFMIGMERNSDVVKMGAYAPLFRNLGGTQWTPNMIEFNHSPDGVVLLSTSYYVHQLFSIYRGRTILDVQSNSAFGPIYWVASKSDTSYIVKLANYSPDKHNIAITFDDKNIDCTSSIHIVNGPPDASNVYRSIKVTPNKFAMSPDADGKFELELPAWGVGVMVVKFS
ncbi:alpha-N-arabinofuranosidase [[Emmonsia] crescens]|uniref:non-reducing end alpha-L-arabinofuranosidase n=1 Tax=[Emmonsia] crescens TaxID=73230 RepID=A0A2B7ZP77_9EURO|nr:alpha-N-arabinofuranosidase [Emmonsia crescens]